MASIESSWRSRTGAGSLPIDELMHVKLSGVPVEEAATTYERLTGKLMLESIKPSSVIFSDGFRVSRWRAHDQARADVVFSVVGIVLSAIPMALTALAVWLESGRPVIYRQERVGQHGRTVHAVQVPVDAARRRGGRARSGPAKATTASRGSAGSSD